MRRTRAVRPLARLAALVLTVCACTSRPEAPAPAAHDHPEGEHADHAGPASLAAWAEGARLFEGLGTFHRKVTTGSDEAQKYFDQGMRYLWAFNHDESTRSFAKAALLDPQCAMCFWGVALTVGPNYNVPMMAEPRAKVAWQALQEAQKAASTTRPVEQALIGALSRRYVGPEALDPSNLGPRLTAYAEAMRAVAKQFPGDLDIQTLWAESMMNVNAWKLWSNDGKPAPGTLEIQAVLEAVLHVDPQHPGANHYYVHTMEASPHPDKALDAAARLDGMMPMAGHLQHMPAHILQRVGRYADAAEANRKGVEADKAYLAATTPLDYYAMYVGHNYQFLAYSTAMQGRKADTLEAVRAFKDAVPAHVLSMMPGIDWYFSETYFALIRFGLWDEMLAEPAPDPKLAGLTGGYLYARAVALAAKGRVDEAKAAASELEKLSAATPADAGAGLNLAKDVFAVAIPAAWARIASVEKRSEEAITRYQEALARENALSYDEPADWFIPVRHELGAYLLHAGKAQEAEAIYRDDLKRNPGNGWSLFGLAASLRAQKRIAEAATVHALFQTAWKDADVTIQASAY